MGQMCPGSVPSAGFRKLFAATLQEFVGSFLFTAAFAIILGGGATVAGFDALAVGVVFAVLVYHGHGISGGQYNPAITIGVAISNPQFGSLRMLYYIIAQFIGAILGGVMAINLITETSTFPMVGDGFSQPKAFLVEFFFSFLLVFTVLRMNEKEDDLGFYAGGVQFVGAACSLGLTGAMFNPALAAGLFAGSEELSEIDGQDSKDFWIFIFAPILGGIFAALYTSLLNLLKDGGVGSEDTSSDEYTSDNETPGGGVQMANYPTQGAVQPRPPVTQPVVPVQQPQYGGQPQYGAPSRAY